MFVSDCLDINARGHLTIGGCDTVSLAETFGTPLYVMDEQAIREALREFKGAMDAYAAATMGEKTWEKAESALQKEALTRALNKAGFSPSQVHFLFAGDLLNQNIASTFGLRETNIPLLGQFGACSTMAQTLAMAAIFVDSGAADVCSAVTSSHFCTAERQFRYPLEYGGQRTPTSQWTATAAGQAILP